MARGRGFSRVRGLGRERVLGADVVGAGVVGAGVVGAGVVVA